MEDYEKKPKFKVGDTIRHKAHGDKYRYTIHGILNDAYVLDSDLVLTFNCEDSWELAESEDEKIRKWLIRDMQNCLEEGAYDGEDIAYAQKAIAWLEMQGEQNPYKKDIGEGYSNPVSYGKELESLMYSAFKGFKDGYSFSDAFYAGVSAQKSLEWSEEDEKMLNSIIDDVTPYGEIPDYPTKEEREYYSEGEKKVNWLNSLKNRVLPQPKQEWSEEDEVMLEQTLQYLKVAAIRNTDPKKVRNCSNWLKSLRPQKHWKPSEEQMDLLDSICTSKYLTTTKTRVLQELYDSLKKLREE